MPVPGRPRRPIDALLPIALIALVTACGGGSGGASAPASAAPTSDGTAASEAPPAATSDTGTGETPAGGLASLVPPETVSAILGETPTPECRTSVLTGSDDCVWTAADGSWLKVEDGTATEMPDLASFRDRMTTTLGLKEPVDGLGQAAYLGTSSRGTRIAVFRDDGRVTWVVINRPGDAAAQAAQVKELASAILAGS